MFSRLASFSILALPLLAVATPANVARRTSSPTTACCASTENATSAVASAIFGLLGIDASDVTGLIGITCSPISVVGVGSGSECSGSTVNCSNGIVGSVGIGCVPVDV